MPTSSRPPLLVGLDPCDPTSRRRLLRSNKARRLTNTSLCPAALRSPFKLASISPPTSRYRDHDRCCWDQQFFDTFPLIIPCHLMCLFICNLPDVVRARASLWPTDH